MPKKDENIIFGHSYTYNEPSIAITYKNQLFAENTGPSHHLQNAFLYKNETESLAPFKALLKKSGFPLSSSTKILFRTAWKTPILKQLFYKVPPEKDLAIFSQNIYQKKLPLILFQIKNKLFPNSKKNFKHYKTDHQLSHAANAVYTSTFDRCAVMVIDDFGEKFSTTFYLFKNNSFHTLQRNEASLGKLYSSICQLCGFQANENGLTKMMERSSSGQFNQSVYDFFKKKIQRQGLKLSIKFEKKDYQELKEMFFTKNTIPIENIAASFQEVFSDTIIDLATVLAKTSKEKNLAYGGSCALNHITNGKILTHTPFENLHIPSAPGDNGNSLGALLYQKYKIQKEPRSLSWHCFW